MDCVVYRGEESYENIPYNFYQMNCHFRKIFIYFSVNVKFRNIALWHMNVYYRFFGVENENFPNSVPSLSRT